MYSKALRLPLCVALLAVAQLAHAILPIQNWETKRGARVYVSFLVFGLDARQSHGKSEPRWNRSMC